MSRDLKKVRDLVMMLFRGRACHAEKTIHFFKCLRLCLERSKNSKKASVARTV